MFEEQFTLTRQGYERLKAELEQFEAQERESLEQIEDIYRDVDRTNDEEAADFEVRTAKEYVDEHIGHLKYVLERATVLDEDPDPQRINAGDRVVVWDLGSRQEQAYTLVDGEESVYRDNVVTTDSPVGKALLGHTTGDMVEVNVPDGWVRLAIRRVENS